MDLHRGKKSSQENQYLDFEGNQDVENMIEKARKDLKTNLLTKRMCETESNAGARIRDGFRNRIFRPSNLLSAYRLEDLFSFDSNGWCPIHYSAFLGYKHCIRIIINEVPILLNMRTSDKFKSTPLLLAAMSGDIKTVILLINLGANLVMVNWYKHSIVSLCSFKQHVNILEYLIFLDDPKLPVWALLIKGLNANLESEALAAAKTLRKMTNISPPTVVNPNWQPANENGICSAIFNVVEGCLSDEVKEETYHVLLNILNPIEVKNASVKDCGAIKILIDKLRLDNETLFTLNTIALNEIAILSDFESEAFTHQVLQQAVHAFSRLQTLEALLVCSKLIADLMKCGFKFQNAFCQCAGVAGFVVERFEACRSKLLAFELLKLAKNAMKNHTENQNILNKAGLGRHIIRLSKAKNRKLMLLSLATIRAMALSNPETQASLIYLGAVWPVLSILKKSRYLSVQEQSAKTLWTLGGVDTEERLKIYEAIGLSVLIEFANSSSEFLNFIGADGTTVLAQAPLSCHDAIFKLGAIASLSSLLVRTRSEETAILSIRAIKYSCFKTAYDKVPKNQKKCLSDTIAAGPVDFLISYLIKNNFPRQDYVKGEAAVAIGAVALGNIESTNYILSNKQFNYCYIISLLRSKDEEVVTLGGEALALLCYNQPSIQSDLSSLEGIYYERFIRNMKTFKMEINVSRVAFQIVVLARVFPDAKSAGPASEGLVKLYDFLKLPKSTNVLQQGRTNWVITQTLGFISAMLHSRSGVPEAYVGLKIVEQLIRLLASTYEHIRASAAITIGYLTFHSFARRLIMRRLRQDIYLLEVLIAYTVDFKLNRQVLEDLKYFKSLGRPVYDFTRGLLIRARVLQVMDEGRPYTMSGIEDPCSGVLGADTVEKDDYTDAIVLTDDPPVSKKDEHLAEEDNTPSETDYKESLIRRKITCLEKLQLERDKKPQRVSEEIANTQGKEEEIWVGEKGEKGEMEEGEGEIRGEEMSETASVKSSGSIDIYTYTY